MYMLSIKVLCSEQHFISPQIICTLSGLLMGVINKKCGPFPRSFCGIEGPQGGPCSAAEALLSQALFS